MPHIQKLAGRGRWQARWRDPEGKERTKVLATEREARSFLVAVEGDKARGAYVDPRKGKVTVGEWARSLPVRPNLQTSARLREVWLLEDLVAPSLGSMPLASVQPVTVRAWVGDLATRYAADTVAKAYQLLGRVMDAAVESGLLAISPCRRIDLPKLRTPEHRYLSTAEVVALADAIEAATGPSSSWPPTPACASVSLPPCGPLTSTSFGGR